MPINVAGPLVICLQGAHSAIEDGAGIEGLIPPTEQSIGQSFALLIPVEVSRSPPGEGAGIVEFDKIFVTGLSPCGGEGSFVEVTTELLEDTTLVILFTVSELDIS